MPPVGFGVQGGLKYFNLKYRLCGHLDTISFLEFSMSFGLESAMCVFSDRQVSQNFAPTLYGTALDFKDHFMSSIGHLLFFRHPKPHCFSMLSHSAFSKLCAVTLPSNVSSTQLKKKILRIKLLVLLSIYTIQQRSLLVNPNG